MSDVIYRKIFRSIAIQKRNGLIGLPGSYRDVSWNGNSGERGLNIAKIPWEWKKEPGFLCIGFEDANRDASRDKHEGTGAGVLEMQWRLGRRTITLNREKKVHIWLLTIFKKILKLTWNLLLQSWHATILFQKHHVFYSSLHNTIVWLHFYLLLICKVKFPP